MRAQKPGTILGMICVGISVFLGSSVLSYTTNTPVSHARPEAQVSQTLGTPALQTKVSVMPYVTGSAQRQTTKKHRAGGPLATFVTADFIGSSRCAMCHELLVDRAGNDMSISNHWRSTMMANASKDPFWRAKVSSEVSRNPALKKVIEEKCSLCHMPMAWIQAGEEKSERAILDYGFLNPTSKFHEAAMDGVSCSLCHQIQDKNLGKKQSFSGKFTINTMIPAPDRKIFGPYQEVVTKPMQTSIGFTPVYGGHINDSALCASCHTLYTPYLDANGKVVGEFPEQTVYLEWRHSDYGVSADSRYDIGENTGTGLICQECHMPHSQAGGVKIAKWAPPETKEKDHFSQHHFVGGNVFMLDILQDHIVPLNLTSSTVKLEDTKKRTITQLQSSSGRLSILEARTGRGKVTTTLQVDNEVGHKFPAGFPSRNLWIHLTVLDKNDQIIFESGRPMPDGRIAGNNADEQKMAYEPHYDVITDHDQVQIYEAVMANTDGVVTYTLLRAARYLKDNRLLPRGFDKKTAPADIGVYGEAAGDKSFIGGSDTITYVIDVKGQSGPFTIKAELLFITISYNFMNDLRQDEHLSLVRRFSRYYDKADKTPIIVAAAQKKVR